MKNYILTILTGLVLFFFHSKVMAEESRPAVLSDQGACPADSLLIAQLTSLNLAYYQNKPVDSLLVHLPAGYATMKIGGWRSQRVAEVLYIIYPGKVSVGIHVRNFQFMNPRLTNTSNPTQNWDINLFKKEAITYTIIFNGSVCINGCENKNK
ncbi:MAG: hypothetical protein JNM88_01390 [Chitinophagaceae bacterium]|nr:hypothetical protein [Chitinophagaceae bacterium]